MPEILHSSETLSACPICRQKEFTKVYEPDIVKCKGCLTLFRNPRPSQKDIADSYNAGTTYAHWQNEEKNFDALWSRRRDFISKLKSTGKLLDIGAGDGRFLKKMMDKSFEVTGTEISATGSNLACSRGLNLRIGQFTDLEFKTDTFDIITLWHVLEHVPNPGEVMKKAVSLLATEGILIIAVPNEAHSIWKYRLGFSRRKSPFDPLYQGGEIHLTHFTPLTLRNLVKSNRLTVRSFEVDDFYPDHGLINRTKIGLYQAMSLSFGWHPAAAMLSVCSKSDIR